MKYSKTSITRKYSIIIFICLFVLIIVSTFFIKLKLNQLEIEGWSNKVKPFNNFKRYDQAIKNDFLKYKDTLILNKYQNLFTYFARGAFNYKSINNARISYPGAISSRGRSTNTIEGFARFFPLAAAWLNSGFAEKIEFDNGIYDLKKSLKTGLIEGTNKMSPEYWGDIKDKDQRIVEAADIALGLWLSRNYIWNELSIKEKEQINSWLEQAIQKEIVDNNWNLFPIIIAKSLENLGFKNDKDLAYINTLYKHYKEKHYLGEGWFDDPPKGIDYYNAWSIHYTLFWLDQIDPNFDPNFIRNSHSEFLTFYKYFFSDNGFPIMGRSICYRMAAPSPIITGAVLLPNEISPGLALKTLDATWSYFIKNNALEFGTVTQGYFEDDLSILDSYSGTGSCLWSLRSLIVAFYANNYIPLWNSKKEQLPIEKSDFFISNKTIGWSIEGDQKKEKIILKIEKNNNNNFYKLKPYGTTNKVKEFMLKRPFRPNNSKALYKNPYYSNEAEILTNENK